MHELSIAMSILDVAHEEAERRGAVRVEAIHVRVGALSGVVSEALLSAYELAREQTEFANCRLVVEDVPATVYCPACGAERAVRSVQWFRCAECDGLVSDLVHGRELEVSALELAE
jgi:hydrogenase nickel incorporation protein HypA/HybF